MQLADGAADLTSCSSSDGQLPLRRSASLSNTWIHYRTAAYVSPVIAVNSRFQHSFGRVGPQAGDSGGRRELNGPPGVSTMLQYLENTFKKPAGAV